VIPQAAVNDAVHAMLDRLQDAGTPQDYYQLNNNQPAERIDGLCFLVTCWLRSGGVEVSP